MAQLYSYTLYSGSPVPVAGVLLLTVPATDTWVIRSITVHNSGAVTGDMVLFDSPGGATVIRYNGVALNDVRYYEGHQVLEPNTQLWFAANASTWDIRISGYKLTP